MTQGWIGVDLDGTLAEYHGWVGPTDIGAPIPRMVERVKLWLDAGREVRIFTARSCAPSREDLCGAATAAEYDALKQRQNDVLAARMAIRFWCKKHIGVELPITCVKDLGMIELWDDRAVSVRENTGEAVRMNLPAGHSMSMVSLTRAIAA
jgi:hypothetical protein